MSEKGAIPCSTANRISIRKAEAGIVTDAGKRTEASLYLRSAHAEGSGKKVAGLAALVYSGGEDVGSQGEMGQNPGLVDS